MNSAYWFSTKRTPIIISSNTSITCYSHDIANEVLIFKQQSSTGTDYIDQSVFSFHSSRSGRLITDWSVEQMNPDIYTAKQQTSNFDLIGIYYNRFARHSGMHYAIYMLFVTNTICFSINCYEVEGAVLAVIEW